MGRLINKSPLSNNTFNLEAVNFVNDYKGPRGDYNISTKDVVDENSIVVSQELYINDESSENAIYIPEDIQANITGDLITFEVSDTELLYTDAGGSNNIGLYSYNKLTKESKFIYKPTNNFTCFANTDYGVLCSGGNSYATILYKKDGSYELLTQTEYYSRIDKYKDLFLMISSQNRKYIGIFKDGNYQKLASNFTITTTQIIAYSQGKVKVSDRYLIIGTNSVGNSCGLLDLKNLTIFDFGVYVDRGILYEDKIAVSGYYTSNPYIYIYDINNMDLLNTLNMPLEGASYYYNWLIPLENNFLLSNSRNSQAQGLYIYQNSDNSFVKIYDSVYNWSTSLKVSNGYLIMGASPSSSDISGLLLLREDNTIEEVNNSGYKSFNKILLLDENNFLLCNGSTQSNPSGSQKGVYNYNSASNSLVRVYPNYSGWDKVRQNIDGTFDISSESNSYNKATIRYNPNTNSSTLIKWEL